MTLDQIRQKYPIFEYKSFFWKNESGNLVCSWEMESGELKFNPKLIIHGAGKNASQMDKGELDNLVFHVGLADMFSYWKPTCSPKIKISAGSLNSDQIAWWHDLLIKGMGQYFYTNQIDFRTADLVVIESSGKDLNSNKPNTDPNNILIPVGGGKDSAVTLELLTQNLKNKKIGAFSMNVSWSQTMLPASKKLMDTAGVKEQIFVERVLDPKLKELKAAGFLDGHIPFSAYMDFLSVLVARLFEYGQVAFSNERSSNEGNIEYLGSLINHQYSKSYEFENKFDQYNKLYLSNINVFSFLRPLYELEIMKVFSHADMNKYYTQFKSCNVGYKNDSWCRSCPKCLSVFVGLFPFVKTETLLNIFGSDLFNDTKLLNLTKDVLGLGKGKPFECIGTYEETVVAFYLSVKKLDGQNLPPLLSFFDKERPILENKLGSLEKLSKLIVNAWNEENHLPLEFSAILKENLLK